MAPSQPPSFRPLEYWKPPKPVRHHIRAKSSAILSLERAKDRHSFANIVEQGAWDTDKKNKSFTTIRGMAGRIPDYGSDHVQLTEDYGQRYGEPPSYQSAAGYGTPQSAFNPKTWSKKQWLFLGLGLVVIIIIVIVVAVVEVKKNRYPDYTALTYSLSETYSGSSFWDDNFDYFNTYDPSSGFVHYVDSEVAASYNLTYASSSSAILRVDTSVTNTTEPNASTGRFSVRVESKKQYGLNNLFIFDVKHTPLGCGTWPALWLSDPANWPTNGEIDVMEAVNVLNATNNQMTLHTTKNCQMDVKRKETGKSLTTNCLNSTNDNAGCGVNAGSQTTFGTDFNSNGGGVLALELRSAGIRMWQFARDSIPSSIFSAPDPSTWSEATADFPNTECNIGNHFKNQSIIANIDLCGSWAGTQSIYGENCPGTCENYVANYPTGFTNAYWEFGNFTIWNAS